MKHNYRDSIFYTDKTEVELFKKLGLYYQCFEYVEKCTSLDRENIFIFRPNYVNVNNNINKTRIYLPFIIYIGDKTIPIIFEKAIY